MNDDSEIEDSLETERSNADDPNDPNLAREDSPQESSSDQTGDKPSTRTRTSGKHRNRNRSRNNSSNKTRTTTRIPLEGFKRCSESNMWKLMMEFYDENGINSWSKGIVPSFVTSNAFIGRSYAKIIVGYISDVISNRNTNVNVNVTGNGNHNVDMNMGMDPCNSTDEKFYIVELGGGSGKLAFYILKALERLSDALGPSFPMDQIVYVLTDFTESNITFWENHAGLKPYVDSGRLDFARFEAVHDDQLHLRNSNKILRKKEVRNPICVVANYLVDTLCHDIFQIENGVLKEGLVSVGVPGRVRSRAGVDANGVETMMAMGNNHRHHPSEIGHEKITSLDNAYEYRPVENPQEYYADVDVDAGGRSTEDGDAAHLARILTWYREYFTSKEEESVEVEGSKASFGASILMPIGFLKAVRNLSDLSTDGKVMIITGDKGGSNPDRFRGLSDPHIAFHGSFSMMVNFHAIQLYCMSRGGFSLLDSKDEAALMVNAFVLTGDQEHATTTTPNFPLDIHGMNETINSKQRSNYRYLCNAFEDNVKSFSPDDFYLMQRSLRAEGTKADLGSIVSLLKLSNWDCEIFFKFRDIILTEIPRATYGLRNELEQGAKRIWDHYYHLNNDKDVAFELGRLLFGLQYFEQALEFYQLSVDLFGSHHVTHHNQGLCNSSLHKYDAAVICFQQSLELKPDYEKAAVWLERVKEFQASSA